MTGTLTQSKISTDNAAKSESVEPVTTNTVTSTRPTGWGRVWRSLAIAMSVPLVWLSVDLGGSLVTPSQDSYLARTAEWTRERGLGAFVNLAEEWVYDLNPPPEGGDPIGGIPVDLEKPSSTPKADQPADATKPGKQPTVPTVPEIKVIAAPKPITPYADKPLPDEGRWQTLVKVKDQPAIRAAFLRPDKVHTSFVTGVTIIDQNLTQIKLHPGTEVPGGQNWGVPPTVPKEDRGQLLATFNSGFLMKDSMGGYWQNGKSVGKLRDGAASMVFTKDGKLQVGVWGRDVKMSDDVTGVRQNLSLLVDGGEIVPEAKKDYTHAFGATLGNNKYVWRSGVGIRKDGAIVTVTGNTLSVLTLAILLRDAGAVRAMTLDINPFWTSYITYSHEADGKIVAKKLTKDQVRDPYRHLEISTRDFVAVYAK